MTSYDVIHSHNTNPESAPIHPLHFPIPNTTQHQTTMTTSATTNINTPGKRRRVPVLPPSVPFRTKRIPLACCLLPAFTIAHYVVWRMICVASGGDTYAYVCVCGSSILIASLRYYFVPKYAPSKLHVEYANEDLKLKIPVLSLLIFCLFFRMVVSNLVSLDESWNGSSGSAFVLRLIASIFLSAASYSCYAGPFAICRCSFSPLYDYLEPVASTTKGSTAILDSKNAWVSKLVLVWRFLSSLVPAWDKQDEVRRKTENILKQSEYSRFGGNFNQSRSLFAESKHASEGKESVEPRVLFQDIHARLFTDSVALRRFTYPTRASSPPFQSTVISLLWHILCGMIYGYLTAKSLPIFSNGLPPSISGVVLLVWMTSTALACFRVKFVGRLRHEIPLANLYYLSKDHIFGFVKNSVHEAVIHDSLPFLFSAQFLMMVFFSGKLLDACSSYGISFSLYVFTLTFVGALLNSLFVVAQLTMLDCAVGIVCTVNIGLTSLTRDTNARFTTVPVMLAICSEFSELIQTFDRPLDSASCLSGSRKFLTANFDQEMEELKRNDLAINDICALILTCEPRISTFEYTNDSTNFADEVCRAMVLESLGGSEYDNDSIFDIPKSSRYIAEVSSIVDCDAPLSVPVGRCLIAFVGAMGEALLRVYDVQITDRSKIENLVICTLPSSMLLQTQFAVVAITRIIKHAMATKGRHHPLTWLQNALFESLFRLRMGLSRHAIAKAGLLLSSNPAEFSDTKVSSLIASHCPELNTLYILCNDAARAIYNADLTSRNEMDRRTKQLRGVPTQCKEWLARV